MKYLILNREFAPNRKWLPIQWIIEWEGVLTGNY